MKASELRIGNYLTNFLGEVFQANGVTIANFHQNEFGEPEPIQLTEEWLIKFGLEVPKDTFFEYDKCTYTNVFSNFKKTSQSCIDATYVINGLHFSEDSNGFWFQIMDKSTKIKYVHQLQNLYFALTGKELEYAPN